MDVEKIVGPLQWRDISAVRHKAMYRIWKEAGLTVTELSRLFNRTASSVSQVIRSMDEAAA